MIGYVKYFDNNKTMFFKASDNKSLKKYTRIWGKISDLLSIKFDSEPVYGDNNKYIKTKDRVNTNFQGKKVRKENVSYNCFSLIMLDSVIRANKKYYPQTFLEECIYVIRKDKMENLINDDLYVHLMNLIIKLIMDLIMRLIINFDKGSDNDKYRD